MENRHKTPFLLRGGADLTSQTLTWINRLVVVLLVLTFGLMALGGLTRVMGAGLSCPDWPLCYGAVVPPMDPLIFLEWFHRQVAQVVGLLTVAVAVLVWRARQTLPGWLRVFSPVALALVIVQGALGAFTVTEYLRFDIVTAHLGTAMLYFSTLVVAFAYLQPAPAPARLGQVSAVAAVSAAVLYVQIILGGLVASQWALHQCLAGSLLCNVMNNHLVGVIPATLAVLVSAWFAWKPWRAMALGLLGLLVLQIGLGIGTFYLQLSVPALTVAHLAVGAALLGGLLLLAVRAARAGRIATTT